ncbi:MAG TPA: FAD-binding oxidoreductase [Silvibacterium sp.]|nr:FAD-binding oxidoreductase [Silvibacterium sp.]
MTEVLDDISASAEWQSAAVVAIETRTPRIKSFFLVPQTPFNFRAGQHVDLRLTAENGYTAMRSYSIGSSPADNRLVELSIERLADGEVSPFFHDVVAVGDDVELRGPLGGHFTWGPLDGGPLLLIGGGSGLVPLMSMIRHQQSAAPTIPIVLLLSARTWDDVLYRDELLEIGRRLSGFKLVLALTREPQRRTGDFGRRIDDAMVSDVLQRLPASPKLVFICGNNPFVNVAADGAVACRIPPENIRTERYGA